MSDPASCDWASAFGVKRHAFDVCVVGGGMAGLCAALASARHGARTVLIQDRPVLGGNASSEVRMWICGAHGRNNKETGILEEIQLENCYRNPSQVYSLWDGVLYGKAAFAPGLTLMLNTTCCGGRRQGSRLASIRAWQMTTQTWHEIEAGLFIDCSGDSVLAPISGARTRQGREARQEFDEDIEPARADARTMGNSILLQLRETDEPQPFVCPAWAYRFETPADLPNRGHGMRGDNFWWLELGGLQDTIGDAEAIRQELLRVAYGVWDYLKHRSPHAEELRSWAIEWMGALPGKRENRRYLGAHILTQNEVREGGRFADIVAYGGWSMDDHHPAGLLYGGKPTIFHPAPSPYGIPYRSLYSADVPNLLCAGRNISVTHAALSSTRVMATCSLLGQAAGTAAALCVRHGCTPAELHEGHLGELQAALMEDDVWLPGRQRPRNGLTLGAQVEAGGAGAAKVVDGHDRPVGEESHAWSGPVGAAITFTWPQAVEVQGLRLVLDSNLNHQKRMPSTYPRQGNHCGVPATLLRCWRVEARRAEGGWDTLARVEGNYQRLVRLAVAAHTDGLRVVPEETWGSPEAHVFSIDVLEHTPASHGQAPAEPLGPRWQEVVARVPAEDLAAPQSGLEATGGRRVGA